METWQRVSIAVATIMVASLLWAEEGIAVMHSRLEIKAVPEGTVVPISNVLAMW